MLFQIYYWQFQQTRMLHVLSTENPKIPVYIPGIARVKQLFQEIFQKQ